MISILKSPAVNGGSNPGPARVPLYLPTIEQDDVDAVSKAVASTFVSGDGPDCRRFEKELAGYLGVKHVFFTTSCTAALDLAFMVKNFPAGSEVIVPNFTFTSTALAPILNNLRVVLVDVDPDSGNIDPTLIERAITEKTVAIVPIDYAGYPADMDTINAIARKHGLYVVQDSAQSIGADYKGRKTGNFADVTCFSFHGTKNLVCGEGGAIVTESDELAERLIYMREKGTDKHAYLSDPSKKGYYEYVDKGNSYVQSNILGALGCSQLAKLDRLNARRRAIASRYMEAFKDLPHMKVRGSEPDVDCNRHLFYLLVEPKHKQHVLDALDALGIGVNIHYRPLHQNEYYRRACDFEESELKASVEFFNKLVRIPMYPLLTDAQVERIIDSVVRVSAEIR
jgi:dTDP-4-amino-4,6-dideoxygalactose transaminase